MSNVDLESKIKELNKKMKVGSIQLGVEFQEAPKLPFSSPRLNYMTYGGLPLGRVAEFSGADGSGKTTTALDLMGQAQKLYPDKKAMLIDVEHTFDTVWATKLGVNVDEVLYVDPDAMSAEETLQYALELIETGSISIAVLDSIGAMVSEQANEKEIGERTYAGVSGCLTTFSNKIAPILARTNTIFIGINQVRDNLNSTYGGVNTPGGRAWKHACSTRLSFRQGSCVDEKGNIVPRSCENPAGNQVDVSLAKSKVCRPDRKVGFYTLNYLTGIDYISDLTELAIKYNVINQAGAWFSIVDTETGEIMTNEEGSPLKFQGKPKVLAELANNKELYNYVSEEVSKLMEQ